MYVPDLDTKNFLVQCKNNAKLFIPSKEMSLVDYMRFGIAVEDNEHLMII